MNTMNKNGFTLVELIVAVGVGLVIMFAIYSVSDMAQRSSVSISQKVVTQQDARAVLDLMAMEIRMASYNPTVANIWNTIPTSTCASIAPYNVAPNSIYKGIQVAKANTILIAMDIGGPLVSAGPPPVYTYGTIGDFPNEYILYSYNGVDTITRNVSCGGNQAILGGAGSSTTVVNNATNPVVNLFTYWGPDIDNPPDANHNLADIDITQKVIADPVKWIPQIRRIIITIVADTELADATTKKKRRMTYSTGVLVRNHVLSPPIPY